MVPNSNDPLGFIDDDMGMDSQSRTDMVRLLVHEIVRVKELINNYNAIPSGAGHLGASILNELVAEAYRSLINYDTVLMHKYYDLLLACD